jgi:hypothetical protein
MLGILQLRCVTPHLGNFNTLGALPTRLSARDLNCGNPDIKKYGFKTDRDEPLCERLQIRVAVSMKQQLIEVGQ